jgi:hypothetical protein
MRHHRRIDLFAAVGTALGLVSGLATVTASAQPLAIAAGGTSANSAPGARTNLGAAASGANSDITSLTVPPSSTTYPGNWFVVGGAVTVSTANISRLNDRVFLGAATLNSGQISTTTTWGDWLSNLGGAWTSAATICQFCAETNNGLDAVIGASEA